MRLDDLPEGGSVEDRREEGGFGGGGGGFGLPIGGGGLSIGAIVALGLIGWALGIDPSLLIGGAEILTGPSQPQVQAPPTARRTTAPQDDMGRFVSKVLGSTELQWKQVFAKDGRVYPAPVLVRYRGAPQASCGCDASELGGSRAKRHGTVLLSGRPEGLSRYLVLRSDRDTLPRLRCRQQDVPVFSGLRDRARGGPSRAEFARHFAQGAAGAARS